MSEFNNSLNMEKRLILAIALSSLVLVLWSIFMPKQQQLPIEAVKTPVQEPQAVFVKEKPAVSLLKFTNSKIEVSFAESDASIKEIVFKDFQAHKFSLENSLYIEQNLNFKQLQQYPDGISFVHKDENKEIIKRFIFHNDSYFIELEINVQNLTNKVLPVTLPLVLGSLDFKTDATQGRFKDFTVVTTEKILRPNARKVNKFVNVKFLGLRDRYFCAILNAISDKDSAFITSDKNNISFIGLTPQELNLQIGQSFAQKFSVYIGPQQVKKISAIDPSWAAIVHYGVFDIVSQVLLQILDIIYSLVRNWGLAIVILSFVIYFLLFPLTLKQMRSMREMQALQPRVLELQKTYKDNPQKLNKEIMELYREHKVNPLGGCLPLVLQMPVFIALYQALMRSIVLKGARFLWIKDLSEPDKLFNLPFNLPFLGRDINILPILMMIGMVIQQKMSSSTTTGVSNEQQKIMTILFPLLFGFIFYHMPAGLVLYWFINSVLTLTFQMKLAKVK